jgi:hypothetical protein
VFFHEPEQLADRGQTPEELINSVYTQRDDSPDIGTRKEHKAASCRRILRQILLHALDLFVEGFSFGLFHLCFESLALRLQPYQIAGRLTEVALV